MMPPDQNSAFIGSAHPDAADLSLYAMRLLGGDQVAAIAEHLSRCAECRAELAHIQGDLALAALAVDLEAPSPAARQRLLEQVAREKRIVPVAQVQVPAAQQIPVQAQIQAEPKAPAPQQPPAPVHAQDQMPAPDQAQVRPIASFGRSGSVLSIEERKPKRRVGLVVLTGLGWAVAAGLCLFAGSLFRERQNLRNDLATQAGEVQRLTADAASAHQLMDALTDPGAMRVSMTMPAATRPKGVPSGGVTYNAEKGSLIFLASNMGPVEQYKAYELWIIPADNSAPVPAGTFHPDRQGNAAVVMPDLPKGIPAKAFGVTVEPDGGSQSPTMPLVMFGS